MRATGGAGPPCLDTSGKVTLLAADLVADLEVPGMPISWRHSRAATHPSQSCRAKCAAGEFKVNLASGALDGLAMPKSKSPEVLSAPTRSASAVRLPIPSSGPLLQDSL